jgi:hypothetical protein
MSPWLCIESWKGLHQCLGIFKSQFLRQYKSPAHGNQRALPGGQKQGRKWVGTALSNSSLFRLRQKNCAGPPQLSSISTIPLNLCNVSILNALHPSGIRINDYMIHIDRRYAEHYAASVGLKMFLKCLKDRHDLPSYVSSPMYLAEDLVEKRSLSKGSWTAPGALVIASAWRT